jgi:uncharacterized protein YdeI (YjbR/CyaY-like superfamily)
MEVRSKFKARNRNEWRSWLTANHKAKTEIWLVSDVRTEHPTVSYLDSVEEAICFGWIDGIAKRISDFEKGQRFTPRRSGSTWTELNRERARRLIRLGLMTDAGKCKLPDLSSRFEISDDILAAIHSNSDARSHFEEFPDLYVRVRIGYIEEMRKRPDEYARRLNNFIRKTTEGKMFGNWNDDGRLL